MVWDLDHAWHDTEWMSSRHQANALGAPVSIYELHLGSWRRVPEEENRPLTYRELAAQLPPYLGEMGFTHVEFLPVMEHPFFGSWGYQTTGYFAPTARYGTPHDFMFLVEELHRHGIGSSSTGSPLTFPVTSMVWCTSMGPICSSMPTPSRASIPNGKATSSTTAATRSDRS